MTACRYASMPARHLTWTDPSKQGPSFHRRWLVALTLRTQSKSLRRRKQLSGSPINCHIERSRNVQFIDFQFFCYLLFDGLSVTAKNSDNGFKAFPFPQSHGICFVFRHGDETDSAFALIRQERQFHCLKSIRTNLLPYHCLNYAMYDYSLVVVFKGIHRNSPAAADRFI